MTGTRGAIARNDLGSPAVDGGADSDLSKGSTTVDFSSQVVLERC
jgi:hypothetical protein